MGNEAKPDTVVVPVETEPKAKAEVATEFCEQCKKVVEVPHECRLNTSCW